MTTARAVQMEAWEWVLREVEGVRLERGREVTFGFLLGLALAIRHPEYAQAIFLGVPDPDDPFERVDRLVADVPNRVEPPEEFA